MPQPGWRVAGLTAFDADATLGAAAGLGRLAYRLDGRHRKRALANVRWAFPDHDDQGQKELARASFEHLVSLAFEVFHTPPIASYRQLGGSRAVAQPQPGDCAADIRPACHPAHRPHRSIGKCSVTCWPCWAFRWRRWPGRWTIRWVNDWLLGVRQKRGLEIITKWQATDRMQAVLDSGGALGFIADQNAGDRGMFVPFFGRLASTYKSIGLLAISRQTPIICGYARRLGQACRYELGTTDIHHARGLGPASAIRFTLRDRSLHPGH